MIDFRYTASTPYANVNYASGSIYFFELCQIMRDFEENNPSTSLCLGVSFQWSRQEEIVYHPVFIPSQDNLYIVQVYLNDSFLFNAKNFQELYLHMTVRGNREMINNMVGIHLTKQRSRSGRMINISNMFFNTSMDAPLFAPFYAVDPDFVFSSPSRSGLDFNWQQEGF